MFVIAFFRYVFVLFGDVFVCVVFHCVFRSLCFARSDYLSN